ncbi:MAG TPA: MarC family protein [Hyphomicrobiales bacterium]|nr:MarC family protein [Hyphomicrobiales bacterium]
MPFDLVSALTTLIVILDPPGLAPSFIALTADMSPPERRAVALRASLNAVVILALAALFGEWLLARLGIGLQAFRIAGGLLLFATAYEMVFERRDDRKTATAEAARSADRIRRVAAFPLAVPLMAGPGAITATILLAGRAAHPAALALLVAMIVVAVAVCLAVFLLADQVERLLGITGRIVLARLLGVLLAALAIQFIVDGVHALVS